jgi:hypothetical protein
LVGEIQDGKIINLFLQYNPQRWLRIKELIVFGTDPNRNGALEETPRS